MVNVDEQTKGYMYANLIKLEKFRRKPEDREAYNEARAALGELGNRVSSLLGRIVEPEAIAVTAKLADLDVVMESLKDAPQDEKLIEEFEISLHDVEYKLNRLFGVKIHDERK
jgi:hypothetical protein